MKTIGLNTRKIQMLLAIWIIMTATTMISCGSDYVGNDPIVFPTESSDQLIPLPFFVRCDNGVPIDPATTTPETPLITDLGRQPILSPEGNQVTWGAWSKVTGSIVAECTEAGTKTTLDLQGLIPNGVYTVWNVTFKDPGFTGEFDSPGLPANVKAFGPIGPNDGSQSGFTASASGEGSISASTPPGTLGTVGEIEACALTDELEWHVVGLYHIDGETHGPVRGPDGNQAEQFAFIFKKAE